MVDGTPPKRRRSTRKSAVKAADPPSSPAFYVSIPKPETAILRVNDYVGPKVELSALQLRKQREQQAKAQSSKKPIEAATTALVVKPYSPPTPVARISSPKSPELPPSPAGSNASLVVKPYNSSSAQKGSAQPTRGQPTTRYFAAPSENRRASKRRRTNEAEPVEAEAAAKEIDLTQSIDEDEALSAGELPINHENGRDSEGEVDNMSTDLPEDRIEQQETLPDPPPGIDTNDAIEDVSPPVQLKTSLHDGDETSGPEAAHQQPQDKSMDGLDDGRDLSQDGHEAETVATSFKAVLGNNVVQKNTDEGIALLIGLQPIESITLGGTMLLRVLKGRVGIYGAQLTSQSKPVEVFAPSTAALPCVSAVPTEEADPTEDQLAEQVIANPFLLACPAIILLSPLKTKIEDLASFARLSGMLGRSGDLFPSHDAEQPSGTGFHLVSDRQLNDYGPRGLKKLVLTEEKEAALRQLDAAHSESLVCLVNGPKKAGKSTLAKMALNRLLSSYQSIAWLDCDLGQSEFTPSGIVSLHVLSNPTIGPSYCHPLTPTRAHYIGSLTPSVNPAQHIEAIHDLFEHYERHVKNPTAEIEETQKRSDLVPLIVNTHGWLKGLGADLLLQIQQCVKPTHILRLGEDVVEPARLGAELDPVIVQLETVSEALSTSRMTPADARVLMSLSYMHYKPATKRWDFSTPLVTQSALALDWTSSALQSVHVGPEEVAYEHILYALNGSLVAVISHSSGSEDSSRLPGLPYDPFAQQRSVKETTCLGFALIRSIDPKTTSFHLLTPIPIEQLSKPISLVKGEIELPVVAMLDSKQISSGREGEGVCEVEWSQVPYLTLEMGEGAGAARRRARKNLMRKSQQG